MYVSGGIYGQLNTVYLSREASANQRDMSYCHPCIFFLICKFRFKEFGVSFSQP